jgi:uncharacterized protein YbbC (DUF1343 family)
LKGVRFRGVSFTPHAPGDRKYADTLLQGIRLEVTDRAVYDPTATAVYLLSILRRVQPEQFSFRPVPFDRLAGGPALREAIEADSEPSAIVRSWEPARRKFLEWRKQFLLYPEP